MSTSFRCAAKRRSSGERDTFPDQRRRSPRLLNIIKEDPPNSPCLKKNNQLPKKRAKNNSVQEKKKKFEIDVVDVHSPVPKILPTHSVVTLDVESPDHKERLTLCATLAMQDHAIQLDYDLELSLLKLLKASYNKAAPDVFIITFKASSETRGTQTFEAHVSDNIYARRVIKVRKIRKLSKDKWYTGILGIPNIEVCVKEKKEKFEEEAEKSPPKLPCKTNNQPNKKFEFCNYFDFKSLSPGYKELLTQYAILAMKDHAIQLNYYSGLQFNQLLAAYYVAVAGEKYVITFEAQSIRHGVQIFKAHVYNSLSMLQVLQVKTLKPIKSKWYTGTLGIPKKE